MSKKVLVVPTVFSSLFVLSGCGYNTMQEQDEAAGAAWSKMLSQYQRHTDLVSNLVNTVRGYARYEDEVLTRVTEARSKVDSIQVTAEDATNPEKLRRFRQTQGELSSVLSRLPVVSEDCPQLKADQNFCGLQVQLEGTENRITLARNNYAKSVQTYNTTIRRFPDSLIARMFDLKQRANFSVENESAASTASKTPF